MQLQRRTRQKQHALGASKHRIREHVFVARKAVFANEVVRLVNNRHVPVRLEQVLDKGGLAHEEIDGHDDVIALQERIWLFFILPDTYKKATDKTFVDQRKELVEAALHFDHPLVLERLGHNNKRTGNTAAHTQRMPDHARFDCLAQADFVTQHKARERRFATGTVTQVILVRNHAHTRANHASHRRRLPHARKFHRTATTFKSLRRHVCSIRRRSTIGFLGLANTRQGTEQIGRSRHLLCGKVGFFHFAATTAYVDNQVIYLAKAFYCERYTLVVLDGLARL